VSESYDLVVIGAGPAGEKAATQAAYYGKRVVVVERRPFPGGVAVSDAGVPTKTLRETALYLTGFRQRNIYGLSLALDASLKLERLKSRTRELFAMMTDVVRLNLARMGVELIQGTAALAGPHAVKIVQDGRERVLEARVILIATGSRPVHPACIPFDDPGVDDSEGIVKIERLPRSLAVIGAGAVGCEYASIFAALGTQVTLVDMADALLGFMDREISGMLADVFKEQGIALQLSSPLEHVRRIEDRLEVHCKGHAPVMVDHVLFAGGRTGNVEGLGLEGAGVAVDAKGRIQVDAHFRTTSPSIYAAGDVIGPPALASVSQEQGRVAACHAFGVSFKETVDPLAPLGVYCVPEVAMAGMTEEAARAAGIDIEVGRGYFNRNTRARIAGATEGMVKLVFRRADRVLLGVHILGDIAAEIVHLGQLVASQGRTIDHFIHATFNVPTFTEAYKYAAYDGLQRLSHPIRNP
jgi:NAD(P) transhydrogenase